MKTARENRRDAMIDRFIKSGFKGMSREEALELLLYYASPSVCTTGVVDKLFKDYPNFAAITDASPEKLMREYGLEEGAVALIHILPDMIKRYQLEDKKLMLESVSVAMEYFSSQLRYEPTEKLMACFLDNILRIKSKATISVGDIHWTAANPLALIEAANKAGSRTVIIAHNHPTQTALVGEADIATTRQIKRALKDVGIQLLDHIIVSSDGTTLSMKNEGFFPLLDN